MTADSFLKPNLTSRKIDKIARSNLSKISHLIENLNVRKLYELTANEGERDNYDVTESISCTLYSAESRRRGCAKQRIKIAGEEIFVLFDRRCELSILNENYYNNLRQAGLNCLYLPTQHVNIVSAFSNKRHRFKKQVLLEINIEGGNRPSGIFVSTTLD